MKSLSDYAKTAIKPRALTCRACRLPPAVKKVVETALTTGSASRPIIARWITEEMKAGKVLPDTLHRHVRHMRERGAK